MAAHGVRFAPGGIRKGAADHDITFIHPKGNEQFPLGGEGVLIELVQAPAEVVAALGGRDQGVERFDALAAELRDAVTVGSKLSRDEMNKR